MNSDNRRIFLAGALIFLVLLLQPYYYNWLGISKPAPQEEIYSEEASFTEPIKEIIKSPLTKTSPIQFKIDEEFIIINTNLYSTTITNRSGGSVVKMSLNEMNSTDYRYRGSYDSNGDYIKENLVELTSLEDSNCTPCLSSFDVAEDTYLLFNTPFTILNSDYSNIYTLESNDVLTLTFEYTDESGMYIHKEVSFRGDSYEIQHNFILQNTDKFYGDHFELRWEGGLAPTEKIQLDDITYASAMSGQSGETEDINQTSEDGGYSRQVLDGNTDWVSIRNKYFTAALIADSKGSFATLESHNGQFPQREITPVYSTSIGFPSSIEQINSRLYLGPLDLEKIQLTGTDLDETMNFGFTLIRPIGKAVLWFLKFLHDTLKLNYGFILIIFALVVRVITGPLTRKSFESSQKMQKIQPLVKKIQAKLKDNPTKMNQEVMALYKEKGVNPLGGCLPMLLQMPLLWALFVVFRSTIEFRGAEFLFWIKDLSQPDVIVNLPFTLPIYGGHIAVLPILMGLSIFLTQRMSMATMDKSQRPMMYIMNGFFVLLFNQFPSGLNLYYTVYNILNYFQQRSIRLKTEGA
ncbi:MAG: membrane protein insertase YidC [Candidatus Marinimicrobia bacterium]|nr:membrane protein insertase YidC [Candidatus Neomarinimicrobiota bacterium]MBT7377844.1 membrane protein insertase YidC [Candidatus Neomarinimicrobiota bacterium]